MSDELWDAAAARVLASSEKAKPADAAAALKPQAEPGGLRVGRLLLKAVSDLPEGAPRRRYIVKGLVYVGEFGAIYGAPAAGKSFMACHLAYAAALGPERLEKATGSDRVLGLRIQQTRVLYLFAEGEGGAEMRIKALRDKYGEAEDFVYIAQPVNLHDDPTAIAEVIAGAQAIGAEWIIVDTLNRVMGGGDENSPDGMGKMLAAFAEIRQATGACVTVVHHAGKDTARGMRGHSSLHGACDHELEVTRPEAGPRVAKVAKCKDGEDGKRFGFELSRVVLGEDEDGDPVTTCVVAEVEGAPDNLGGGRLSGIRGSVLSVLFDVAAERGQRRAEPNIPEGVVCIREDDWREAAYARLFVDAAPDARQKAFRRAANDLIGARAVGKWGPWVWSTK